MEPGRERLTNAQTLRNRSRRPLVMALVTSLVSACNFAPRYTEPTTPQPPAFKETGDWVVATPRDEIPGESWWQVFNDPELDKLEEQVTATNQNLKVAVAQFDEARADAKAAHADYYPTVDANGSAAPYRSVAARGESLPNTTYNNYSLGLDLQYELDVWGRVRNEVRAANAAVSERGRPRDGESESACGTRC